ncbi:tyrosine-protein phosphatase [Crossiella sp. NPDC003009]
MDSTTRRTFLKAGTAALAAVLASAGEADAHPCTAWSCPEPGKPIIIEGALNVRDVGGYETTEGHTVRYSQVFRSGTLAYVTPRGVQRLATLSLSTVADFRTAAEVRNQGPDRLPAGVRSISIPIGEANAANTAALDPALVELYRDYVRNSSWRAGFGRALRHIATTADRPLLYHDSAGAHRSGWFTAVLLTLLHVPKGQVYADYLRSNDALGGTYAHREYLDAAFDQVVRDYGAFNSFITDGLGLSTTTALQIRAYLLSLA